MVPPVSERAAPRLLLDEQAIGKSLSRIAHEVIERNAPPSGPGLDRVALVGIQLRGAPLASRLRRLVEERSGAQLPVGALDITFHRDDVHIRDGARPPRGGPHARDPPGIRRSPPPAPKDPAPAPTSR